jgi:hypothetical protein
LRGGLGDQFSDLFPRLSASFHSCNPQRIPVGQNAKNIELGSSKGKVLPLGYAYEN